MTIATQQPAIHFTSFAVQQCIRVNYSDEVVYRNIHPSQDQWALGVVNDASFQEAQRETGEAFTLVTVDDTEGEGVIVASERCEAYYVAMTAGIRQSLCAMGSMGASTGASSLSPAARRAWKTPIR